MEDKNKLAKELAYEGTYILKTNDSELGAVEVVSAYKELCRVENSFRHLKDVIETRPIYHWKESRVKAHIFVATLISANAESGRTIEKNGIYLSAVEAYRAFDGIAELKFAGRTHRLVSSAGREARRVIKVLGIKQIQPPSRVNME